MSTAASIVTAPVKLASKTVDVMTTSQSEADENRGRKMRKREEKLGKLDRKYQKYMKKCEAGDDSACYKARDTYAEMQTLASSMSYAPPPPRD